MYSDFLANDDFVDVIEFIPVPIEGVDIAIQRFEFGTTPNSNIRRLGSEE